MYFKHQFLHLLWYSLLWVYITESAFCFRDSRLLCTWWRKACPFETGRVVFILLMVYQEVFYIFNCTLSTSFFIYCDPTRCSQFWWWTSWSQRRNHINKLWAFKNCKWHSCWIKKCCFYIINAVLFSFGSFNYKTRHRSLKSFFFFTAGFNKHWSISPLITVSVQLCSISVTLLFPWFYKKKKKNVLVFFFSFNTLEGDFSFSIFLAILSLQYLQRILVSFYKLMTIPFNCNFSSSTIIWHFKFLDEILKHLQRKFKCVQNIVRSVWLITICERKHKFRNLLRLSQKNNYWIM